MMGMKDMRLSLDVFDGQQTCPKAQIERHCFPSTQHASLDANDYTAHKHHQDKTNAHFRDFHFPPPPRKTHNFHAKCLQHGHVV